RRLRTLRDLSAQTTNARTPEEACRLATQALTANRHDVPFVVFYLLDSDWTTARRVEIYGIEAEAGAAAEWISLAEAEAEKWPLGQGWAEGGPVMVTRIPGAPKGVNAEPWPEPVEKAVILPIARAGQTTPYGFIVAGISPRRVW